MSSSAAALQPVCASCRRPAGASRVLAAGARAAIGFHVGDPADASDRRPAVHPAVPKPLYGLSAQQMVTLGAQPTPFATADESLKGELIAAREAYRNSVLDFRVVRPLGFRGESGEAEALHSALQTRMGGGTDGKAAGQAPPDLPSLLLDSRICYLGMALVPSVTELIVAELLYLNFNNPEKPVYFYINSTGSQSQDGSAVGFETEAYAIFDTMRYVRPAITTVCVGKAWGNAAMLLASGKKGERYSLPHASIVLQPPRINRTSDCATNVMIKANELQANTDTYADFMAEFTGRPRAELDASLGRKMYLTPRAAVEFGLVDKVVAAGQGLARDKKDYEAELVRDTAAGRVSPREAPAGAGRGGRGGGDE